MAHCHGRRYPRRDAGCWLGSQHSLSLLDLLIHLGAGLLVDALELFLAAYVPFEQLLLETGDGILSRAHTLDLLTGSVGSSRVGHGVTTISIGHVLHDERTIAGCSPFLAILDGSLNSQDIHTIDLETWDVLTTLVVVGKSR